MIVFRPGSHVYRLVAVLGITGEYPTTGLHLLGNERVVKALVHNLESVQLFHNEQTGEEMTCRLINISGKGRRKTIRFYRPALPILNWVHPRALGYYLYAFNNHKFSGDERHKDRMHRSAEAVAMCMRAGIEFRPYMTPNLQHRIIHRVIHDTPVYYGSREIKEQDEDDVYKIAYSRLVGAVFTPGNCMAVYNTRDALMKWNGLSEMKTRLMVEDIAGMNAKVHSVDSAIMFGRSYDDALKMLEAYEKTSRREKSSTAPIIMCTLSPKLRLAYGRCGYSSSQTGINKCSMLPMKTRCCLMAWAILIMTLSRMEHFTLPPSTVTWSDSSGLNPGQRCMQRAASKGEKI